MWNQSKIGQPRELGGSQICLGHKALPLSTCLRGQATQSLRLPERHAIKI